MHRIGGIEKEVDTGHLELFARQPPGDDRSRKAKVDGVADHIPDQDVSTGRRAASSRWSAGAPPSARSTRRSAGPAPRAWTSATSTSATSGRCRRIWAICCASYDKVLVPEMNTGQFKTVLRDQFLVDAKPLNKVSGQPFRIAEIEAAIEEAASHERHDPHRQTT
jgi:2-oxoglutarate ferredoxin oxidoreductase subunit alpha